MSRMWFRAAIVAVSTAATVGLVFGGVGIGRISPVRPAAAPVLPTESAATPPRVVPAPRSRAVPVVHHSRPTIRLSVPLDRAAAIATTSGLRAGIAVLDIRTGRIYSAGDVDAPFGTASVVKVLIAADLLAHHEMTGSTADLAYSMITRSDDDAANALWIRVGGPALEPWIAKHYGISGLGSPNSIPGRWGNTHVTPRGLVRLYAKLRADPAVWPWLGRAMHHAARVAKDGTDQFFGLPAAFPGAAIKQGWASGSADSPADAVINTTGYLDHDRYAVAILTEGRDNNGTTDGRGFNAPEAAAVTAMAKQLAGAIPR
jgi:beta-lactamase family protein